MPARSRLALRLAGGGLLVATGAIHLDLYLTGYRSIPTIGWLFLLQVIAAFGLGVAVLATGGWLAAAAGAGFALATLGGYLLSLAGPASRRRPSSGPPARRRTLLLPPVGDREKPWERSGSDVHSLG